MNTNDKQHLQLDSMYIMNMLEQFWLNTSETRSYPEAISSLCNQFSKLQITLIEEKRLCEAEVLLEAIEVVKQSFRQNDHANQVVANLFNLMTVSYSIGKNLPVESLVGKLNELFETPKTPDVDIEAITEALTHAAVEQRSQEGRDHAKNAKELEWRDTKSFATEFFKKHPDKKPSELAEMFSFSLKLHNQKITPNPALKVPKQNTVARWVSSFRDSGRF